MTALGIAAFWPGTTGARTSLRAACKPLILTPADVAGALGVPPAQVSMAPVASSGIPPVRGKPPFKGKTFECDWSLSAVSQLGFGEGRVSLFVFATAAEASRWFTAYTAGEAPPCKKVSFATTACLEVSPVPSGVFPLFQALQDRIVVWVHMRQRPLDRRVLEALATKVLVRAPRVA